MTHHRREQPRTRGFRARPYMLDCAIVAAAILIGFLIRSQFAYSIPSYSPTSPVGLFKSDPAMLFWFTERIADNGGAIPPDFAASKMVQWPDAVDLRAEFPMLQPWLAANAWRIWNGLGGGLPLHTFCIGFFALIASLTAAGVYGLSRELTGKRLTAALAVLLWLLLAANYRTIGFVLMGEDLSFPALAIHLWLVARAARLRTKASFLLAGLALLAAMAAWHAAGFFLLLEAGAFFVWYLRSGANPFATASSWLVLLPLGAGCAVEPMLRGKLQILSLPMDLSLSLLALAFIEKRRRLPVGLRAAAAFGLTLSLLGLGVLVSRSIGSGIGDYAHVFELVAAKLRYLGHKPVDPQALSFDVRMLWQGPFETATLRDLGFLLGFSLLGLLAAPRLGARAWRRGTAGDLRTSAEAVLVPLALASLLASWLILRTVILAGFLAPVALALALERRGSRRLILAGFALPVVFAAVLLPKYLATSRNNPWHTTAWKLREIVRMVDANVPAGAAVAADEMDSSTLLAHTGRPILTQPKYEWAAARARLEEFRLAATRGTPAELAAFLDAHDCHYVLLDTMVLWGSNYQVGLGGPRERYLPGSALSIVESTPDHLPGFKLLAQARGRKDPRAQGPELFLALYQRQAD